MQLEIKVVHHLSPALEAIVGQLLPLLSSSPTAAANVQVPQSLKTDPALLERVKEAVETPADEPSEEKKNKGGRPRKSTIAEAVPTVAPSVPATTNVATLPGLPGGDVIAPGEVTVDELKAAVMKLAGARGNVPYIEIRNALGEPNVATCDAAMRKRWKACLDAETATAGAGIALAKAGA